MKITETCQNHQTENISLDILTAGTFYIILSLGALDTLRKHSLASQEMASVRNGCKGSDGFVRTVVRSAVFSTSKLVVAYLPQDEPGYVSMRAPTLTLGAAVMKLHLAAAA